MSYGNRILNNFNRKWSQGNELKLSFIGILCDIKPFCQFYVRNFFFWWTTDLNVKKQLSENKWLESFFPFLKKNWNDLNIISTGCRWRGNQQGNAKVEPLNKKYGCLSLYKMKHFFEVSEFPVLSLTANNCIQNSKFSPLVLRFSLSFCTFCHF